MNIEHLKFNQLLKFLKNKKEVLKIEKNLKKKILEKLKKYIYKLV